MDPLGLPQGAPIEPTQRPAAAQPDDGRTPTFRALLESLQRFAAPPEPTAPVEDADALRSALERADDEFQQVMDMRRRLEDAFRARS